MTMIISHDHNFTPARSMYLNNVTVKIENSQMRAFAENPDTAAQLDLGTQGRQGKIQISKDSD